MQVTEVAHITKVIEIACVRQKMSLVHCVQLLQAKGIPDAQIHLSVRAFIVNTLKACG